MEMEIWKIDGHVAEILRAVLSIARGKRMILTSHQELRRYTNLMPQSRVARCLKALRREGVIALKTSWQGTQITLLRRLQIAAPQGMAARK